MRLLLLYLFASPAFLWSIYELDGTGIFIYLGYGPAYLASLVVIAGALIHFGKKPRGRAEAISLLIGCLVVLAGAFICPTIPTSGTERRFLKRSSRLTRHVAAPYRAGGNGSDVYPRIFLSPTRGRLNR